LERGRRVPVEPRYVTATSSEVLKGCFQLQVTSVMRSYGSISRLICKKT
jgi:hypothetical protein